MNRKEFDSLVRKALLEIPREFREVLKNIQIVVDDWPDRNLMEEVSGDSDEGLYGLFIGRPLTECHFDDWGELPPTIHIYRKPLEEDFPDVEELAREIEITVAHEVAHYLGLDEETLKSYGYD
jgi:predicted Zn-dependent protease with MMP-like domain